MRARMVSGVIVFLSIPALGQDTRHVSEPVIPPTCTVLKAHLAPAKDGALAEGDEDSMDTERIQNALDACPPGQAVELQRAGAARAFLSGPLQLRAGVTLRIDAETTLFGSRRARDYDVSPGSCGRVAEKGDGCQPLIRADHVANAAVMGEGVIDGRGGARLAGDKVSWWDLAQQAKVRNLYQNCPRIMVLTAADNFTLYRITLKNSPNFHVLYRGGNGFTAWGVIIDTPRNARNTDGIDPANATNVTITHCYIHAGDDQVAIKANTLGPSSHISVTHNHFYTGHGISIGSDTEGGVSAVRVDDLSIDGADNGIRIKSNSSRGGLVHNVVYENVCIRNTKNPILMDSNYSFYGKERGQLPTFTGILLRNVRVLGPGLITLDGFDSTHRLGVTFDGVLLGAPEKTRVAADFADVTLGPGPVNFFPTGKDVRVAGKATAGSPAACEDMFVPLPEK